MRVGSDPSKRGNIFIGPGQAPLLTSGPACTTSQRAEPASRAVKTKVPQSGQELTITGEQVTMVAIAAAKDSLKSANDANYYFTNGTLTACDDSIPDYYFKANEIKRTGSFVVARPAVLYIGDVPVMWLPFLFQDIRSGRRSGIIAPNVGVSPTSSGTASRTGATSRGWATTSPSAIILDAQVSLDWRSNAGESDFNDRWLHAVQRRVPVSLARPVRERATLPLSHTDAGGPGERRNQLGPSAELHAQQRRSR